ncbi:outer membrane beta-barrel protein [Elongatibacter sediminis]|uniref:Outer membrane beta-barrel protein n=1 Tax=Elongatibacter sediminis TaxID=3119006 RepID=A0AAW9R5J9_9GAMM
MPGALLAQYYDDPGLGSRPVAAHPQDYKPLGIRAGAFMLHPGVQVGAEYTDNVLFSDGEKSSDTIFHVRPYISAQSTWSQHSLNVSLSADIARHADFSVRDYEDYFFGVSGRVDVKTRSYLTYSVDYLDLHEDLNSRGSEQGIEPTRYNSTGFTLGYDHTFNRLSLGASYGWSQFDYDNVLDANGEIIDNQDRDRDSNTYSLRAGYQFRTDQQVYVSYTGYSRDFDQQFDRNGYERAGDGYSVNGGLRLSITGKLNGNIFASYHNRDFDDPRLPSADGFAGGAGLTWLPTQLTTVYASMASSIEDTTNRDSSGYLQRIYTLRADHELRRHLQLNTFVSYRTYDYQPIENAPETARSQDDSWRAGFGANWFINRHAYLNASYTWESLDSSVANDDYTVNRVWLLLGLEY